MKTIRGNLKCAVTGLMMLLLWACSGKKAEDIVPQEFIQFAKTIDNVQDIIVQGKDLHVHILIDSADAGCDEEWNFKNGGFILKVAFNERWRNYIDSNKYNMHIHRSFDYERSDFQYVASYSSSEIVNMQNRFLHPDLLQREINYVTDNFSCSEYQEMFLMLRTFKSDTLFVSGDTCFSQLFFNCRSNGARSCEDIERIRSMCNYVLQDKPDPICASLSRHFTELDSISSIK